MHRLGGGDGPYNPNAYPYLAFPSEAEEVSSNLPPPSVYSRGAPLGAHLFGAHPLGVPPSALPRSRYMSPLDNVGGGGMLPQHPVNPMASRKRPGPPGGHQRISPDPGDPKDYGRGRGYGRERDEECSFDAAADSDEERGRLQHHRMDGSSIPRHSRIQPPPGIPPAARGGGLAYAQRPPPLPGFDGPPGGPAPLSYADFSPGMRALHQSAGRLPYRREGADTPPLPWDPPMRSSSKRPASDVAVGVPPHYLQASANKIRKLSPLPPGPVLPLSALRASRPREHEGVEGFNPDDDDYPPRRADEAGLAPSQLLSDLVREVQKHARLLQTPVDAEDVRDELMSWRMEARRSEGEQGGLNHIYIDSEGRAHSSKAQALTALYEILVPEFSPGIERPASLLHAPGASLSSQRPSPRRSAKPKPDLLEGPLGGGNSNISRMNAFYSSRSNYQKIAPKLPLRLGQYVVQDFGRIDPSRAQYHCETEIWPVGFRCLRVFYSEILRQHVSFQCDILDGGDQGPRFRVVMDFIDSHPVSSHEGRTPMKAWKPALERLLKIERETDERHAERKQKRLLAGRRDVQGLKLDPEEQMLRRKIQRLYEERDEVKHTLAQERLEMVARMKETMPPVPPKRGRASKQVAPTDFHSFFIPKVAKLIEGMPGAERCTAYEFMEQRGVIVEDDFMPVEARKGPGFEQSPPLGLPRQDRKMPLQIPPPLPLPPPVPYAREMERADRERDRESRDRERERLAEEELMRRRRREHDKEAQRHQKLLEKEEKKKAREAEKEERKQRLVEEKKRRDKEKEMEKELSKVRKKLESDIHRRRCATQAFLFAYGEREEAEVRLSKEGRVLVEDSELEGFETALPIVKGRRETDLTASQMAHVVQLWDFLNTFHGALDIKTVPSLKLLKTVVRTARRFELGELPSKREARQLQVLDLLGMKMVSILIPDVIRSLGGYSSADLIDPLPCNLMTWRELGRWALIVAAFQAMGLERGTQMMAGKQCGTGNNLDSIERKTILLVKARALRQQRGQRFSVESLTVRIPAPSPLVLPPSSWQAALEALRYLPLKLEWVEPEISKAIQAAEKEGEEGVMVKLVTAKEALEKSVEKGKAQALQVLDEHRNQIYGLGPRRQVGFSAADRSMRLVLDAENQPTVGETVPIQPPSLDAASNADTASADGPPPGLPARQMSAISLASSAYAESATSEPFKAKSEGGNDDMSVSQAPSRGSSPDASGEKEKAGSPDNKTEMDVSAGGDDKHERDDDDESDAGSEPARITMADLEGKPETVKRCFAVLEAVMDSEHAKGFILLPDPMDVVDYYQVVANPKAFIEIARSLADGKYDDSVGEFAADVRLIFANCAVYNHEFSEYQVQADRLSVKFERLLLDWVLDPKAPPLEQCKDKLCTICLDSCLIKTRRAECSRCDSFFHRVCLGLSEAPEGDGTWFCESCVMEKRPADIDPHLGLVVVKTFPGLGTVSGVVEHVQYLMTGATYRLRYPRLTEEMTRQELQALMASQPLSDDSSSSELMSSLQRAKEIDPRAEVEAQGYSGWGLGNTWGGVPHPPRKLDPTFSLIARQATEEDPEIDAMQSAIRALEQDHLSVDEMLTCISSLVGQVGYMGELRGHIDKNDIDYVSILNAHGADQDNFDEAAVRQAFVQERPVVAQCEDEEELLRELGEPATTFEEGEEDEEDEIASESEEEELEDGEDDEKEEEEMVDDSDEADGSIAAGDGDATRASSAMEVEESGEDGSRTEDGKQGQESEKKEEAATPAVEQAGGAGGKEAEAGATEKGSKAAGAPRTEVDAHRKAELEELKNEIQAHRKNFAAKLFADAVNEEVRKSLGKAAARMHRRLIAREVRRSQGHVDEEDDDDHSDDEDDDDEEDSAVHEGEDEHRLVCHYCHEDEKYLCSLMLHGPSLEEFRMILAASKDEEINEEAHGLAWLPMDQSLAKEEEGLAQRFGSDIRKGSVAVHEHCAGLLAIARQNAARKGLVREKRHSLEPVACQGKGRTSVLGRDRRGRLYWQYAAEPSTLFVQPFDPKGQPEFEDAPYPVDPATQESWVYYTTPLEVACLLQYLNPLGSREGPLRAMIMKHYPEAAAEYEKLSQSNDASVLPELESKEAEEGVPQDAEGSSASSGSSGTPASFEEEEELLVGGKNGLWWNAKVLCRSDEGGQRRYRVQFVGWDMASEWIAESDEVEGEPPGTLRLRKKTKQAEADKEAAWTAYHGRKLQLFQRQVPMHHLEAYRHVDNAKRNRGPGRFERPFQWVHGESHPIDDLKALLLLMEAALPVGSVDDDPDEKFIPLKIRKSERNTWVSNVKNATSAVQLMESLVLLEHTIHLQWQRRLMDKREMYNRVMPNYTMALKYCTPQSVALRLWSLDQLINYNLIDETGIVRKKLKASKFGPSGSSSASLLSPAQPTTETKPRSSGGRKKRHR